MRLTDGELMTTLKLVREAQKTHVCGPMLGGYEKKLVDEVNGRMEKAKAEDEAAKAGDK